MIEKYTLIIRLNCPFVNELLAKLNPHSIIVPAYDILSSPKTRGKLQKCGYSLHKMLGYSGKIKLHLIMEDDECDKIYHNNARDMVLRLVKLTGVRDFIGLDTYTYKDLDREYNHTFTNNKLQAHLETMLSLVGLPANITITPLIKGYDMESFRLCSRFASLCGHKNFAFHCGNYVSGSADELKELQAITGMMKKHCNELTLVGFSSPRLFARFRHADYFAGMTPYVLGYTYGRILVKNDIGSGYHKIAYNKKEMTIIDAIKHNYDFIKEAASGSMDQTTLLQFQNGQPKTNFTLKNFVRG